MAAECRLAPTRSRFSDNSFENCESGSGFVYPTFDIYEGRSISKLQNGIILMLFII